MSWSVVAGLLWSVSDGYCLDGFGGLRIVGVGFGRCGQFCYGMDGLDTVRYVVAVAIWLVMVSYGAVS